jgi:hypothetical protein
MSDPCMRDDGICRRCSHGCYEVDTCNRCGEEFGRPDLDGDGLCPDCADDRAAEEAEDQRREDAMDEQNGKGAV